MNNKKCILFVAALAAICVVVMAFAEDKPPAEATSTTTEGEARAAPEVMHLVSEGRYRMFCVVIGRNIVHVHIFDTETGRLWRNANSLFSLDTGAWMAVGPRECHQRP